MEIWKYGNMEIWKYGNMEIWKYGNMEMEIWKRRRSHIAIFNIILITAVCGKVAITLNTRLSIYYIVCGNIHRLLFNQI